MSTPPVASLLLIALLPISVAGREQSDMRAQLPEGAQAVSLDGKPLYSPEPSQGALDKLAQARADYEADPDDADNIIWYGRRVAYTGDYRTAIGIYGEGIDKHPDDARMYRHRGHRYITVREFDRALADLERAATLIEGTANETEPDGLPNALNTPVSSLHGNIWYHLGLAYYLEQDWDNALRAFDNGFNAGRNDDNRVSTTHWRYMILRRMGKESEAAKVLDAVNAEMEVIENMTYHRLCLFYKGDISADELLGDTQDNPTGAAVVYGLANWHAYEGNDDQAQDMLEELSSTQSWAAFGFIAAEADLAKR